MRIFVSLLLCISYLTMIAPEALSILACILILAFLYSSVGHGGASGYLALMSLFGIAPMIMRPNALLLNIFVAGIAFYQFYRMGYFRWNLFLPFAIASVPMAFWGASITVDPVWYKRILGICLIIATLRIANVFGNRSNTGTSKLLVIPALIIGSILGFFSGMIGIGGGIILSPIILLTNWGSIKETAAVSALFILLNSISGLSGLLYNGATFQPQMYLWVMVAIVGGLAGSYFGSAKLNNANVRNLLAVVLIIASIKLIIV